LASVRPADGGVRAGAYGSEVDVAICVFVEVHLALAAGAASADGGEEEQEGDEEGGDGGGRHVWWCVVGSVMMLGGVEGEWMMGGKSLRVSARSFIQLAGNRMLL